MITVNRSIARALVAAALVAAGAEGAAAQTGFKLEVAPTIMIRDPGVDRALFEDTDPNQTPILRDAIIDVLVSTGITARIVAGGPLIGVELRGIFMEPGTAHWFENVDPVGNGVSFGTADLFGALSGLTTIDLYADHDSNFRSLEANLRVGGEVFGFFAGMRQIAVTDHLRLTMDVAPSGLLGTQTLDITARNLLYGPQIGAELNLPLFGRFSASAFVKMAMVQNEMSADFALSGTLNGGATNTWSDNRSEPTTATEAGLNVAWNLNDNLGVFAGASILHIAQAGSATASLPNLNLGAGTGGVDTETVIYYGARVGLRLSF